MVQKYHNSRKQILERGRRSRGIYKRGAVEQQEEEWKREGKVLLWKEKIYVPDSAMLRKEIITKHHDSRLAGHPGYTKMYKLITRNY